MRDLTTLVRTVTERLIAQLDAHLPGQLEAFYLVGSIALGDYREGQSDIDFVAVLAERAELDALATVHAQLARDYPSIHCDGIYLKPGDLVAPPQGCGPEVREGRLLANSSGERHAVTWQLLADAGIALRGPTPRGDWLDAGRDAAIDYSRANLHSYWRPWIDKRRHLSRPMGWSLLAGDAVVWGCLGIARLHKTIVTGRVPSKTEAGDYALGDFAQHAAIIEESLRLRRHPDTASRYSSPFVRRRDVIAFMDAVLRTDQTRRR